MLRLISLVLFVLLTVTAIAWLTGIESPFAGARTHSVLSQKGESPDGAEGKPAGPSLLLGSNVDASKSNPNKTPAVAAAAVPTLVTVEARPGAEWPDEPAVKKLLARLAAEGVTASPGGGSGCFIDRQGAILTTFSSLLGGFAWTARTADGQEYEVALVGVDAAADLALLRAAKPDAAPVRWASVPPGFAENLLMLGFSASEGPRVASVMTGSGLLETTLPGEALALKYYLVDGAEQRGGWLLLNLDGTAAGLVARVAVGGDVAKTRVVICPESLAQMIELLKDSPVPRRVYPGLTVSELTPALARQSDALPNHGLLVTNVSADSPLKASGLQPGDVVVWLGNAPVISKARFFQALSGMAIGAKVPLIVRRGDQSLTLHVILREHKNVAQDWLDLVAKHQKSKPPAASGQ